MPSTYTGKILLVPFQQLLERRMFAAIEVALWKETDDAKLRSWLEEDTLIDQHDNAALTARMMGATPLHRVAAVQPPVSLVEILLSRVSTIYKNAPLDAIDVLGRTPLHVAAAMGSTEIIPLLTHGCTSEPTLVTASLIPDSWKRNPLHWACTHRRAAAASHSGSMRHIMAKVICGGACVNMLDTVRLLVDVFPEAVLLRDRDSMTPLDLAVEHEADPRIIKLVYKTTNLLSRTRDAETALLKKSLSTSHRSLPQGFPEEITVDTISETQSQQSSNGSSVYTRVEF